MVTSRRQFLVGAVGSLVTVGCLPPSESSPVDLSWRRRGFGDGEVLKPRAITIDDQDRLYLADTTGRISRFDADGNYQLHWRTPAAANGRPTGLGFSPGSQNADGQPRILVADTHYYRMLVYRPDGQWCESETIGGTAGAKPGEFAFVTDVASGGNGDRYVGEYNAQDRIQRFDAEGNWMSAWGQTGDQPGQFVRPQSLMVQDDLLYVADSCNHRIQRFDTRSSVPSFVDQWGKPGEKAGEMFYPYGLDFMSDGNIVVAEYKNARVQLLTPEGKSLATWGTHGVGPGQLNLPWGVVVDSLDRIHVLDSENHRVQRFWF